MSVCINLLVLYLNIFEHDFNPSDGIDAFVLIFFANEIPAPFDRAVLIKGFFLLGLLCAFMTSFFHMFPLSLYNISFKM